LDPHVQYLQVVVVVEKEVELKEQEVQVVVVQQDVLALVMDSQEQLTPVVVVEELQHLEQTQEVMVAQE
tara:strand:+ start:315 stop:521 length:207 start_codon:yes stop_codon:yes gene_type:complete